MILASPCVGTCRIDPVTGWCLGCARSGAEIASWPGQSEAWRTAVWQALPARFERLGIACRRLPWTTSDIRDFVARTLTRAAGCWDVGVPGARAEFAPRPGAKVALRVRGTCIEAVNEVGALRLDIDDDVRALTFDPPATPAGRQTIVLAVSRERGRLPLATGITDLGEDLAALGPGGAEARLFDLGLGRKEARFCLRCAPGAARDALSAAAGLSLADAWARIGPALGDESVACVVESALGRIEVMAPPAAPGARAPTCAKAQLRPEHLAAHAALAANTALPRAYLPGAVFHRAS